VEEAGGLVQFLPLPGTRSEALEVADLRRRTDPTAAVRVLLGEDADKGRLLEGLGGARHVHLATHGYFAPPELGSALAPKPDAASDHSFEGGMCRNAESLWYPGLLSGLACAGAADPPKDPATAALEVGRCLLSAEEVAGLDLKGCELAVLSACETGLGRVAGGEGVLGLQRAFHQAGARTVIASLWKVDDDATRALMARFYSNLWERGLAPLESLRQAQISILDDPDYGAGGEPRLWAAWTLSTAPRK
jgi:CHAT domain-containing protein